MGSIYTKYEKIKYEITSLKNEITSLKNEIDSKSYDYIDDQIDRIVNILKVNNIDMEDWYEYEYQREMNKESKRNLFCHPNTWRIKPN